MRWLTRIPTAAAVATAVVAAAVVGTAAPAPAAPAPAAAPVDYVALGDSYSSGVGAPPYLSGTCTRSNNSYARQWANTHEVTSFQFAACGGATTDSLLASQIGAVTAGTDLVSVTIGGNDVGFADAVVSCTFGSDQDCENTLAAGATQATTVLPGKLDAVYTAIRTRAPNATVVVLGYPRLVSPTGSCGLFNLSTRKRTALNSGADVLTGVLAARAAAAGFTFVDARPVFTGHGACGPSPWINRFSLFNLVDSYHPNLAGYTQGYLPMLNSVTG
jgi:lysophospholipase L1-like esterase